MALFATLGVSIECRFAELSHCYAKRIMQCVVMLNVLAPIQQLQLLGVHSKLPCLVMIRKLSAKLMELAYRRPVEIVILTLKNFTFALCCDNPSVS